MSYITRLSKIAYDPFFMAVDVFGRNYTNSSKRKHIQYRKKMLQKMNKRHK